MNLQEALKRSEFCTARALIDNQTVTVEQIEHGFLVFYGDKNKPFVTFDALQIFLGEEATQQDWLPIQEEEQGR